MNATRVISLSPVDLAIIAIYFVAVLAIGLAPEELHQNRRRFLPGWPRHDCLGGRPQLRLSEPRLELELLGWAGSAYQYGILAAHWYWIGAIPAMVFLGIVMMPFRTTFSKTHSVPGYLNLRFGPAASGLSAISFAAMTILMSGVNLCTRWPW